MGGQRRATSLLILLGLRWRRAAEHRNGRLGETEGDGRWAGVGEKKTLREGARAVGTKDRRDKGDSKSCLKNLRRRFTFRYKF
jgi:hypothetical protein